jgi:hypothetical protein
VKAARADVGVAVGGVRLRGSLDVLVLAAEGLHLAHPGDALLQVGVDAPISRATGGTPPRLAEK